MLGGFGWEEFYFGFRGKRGLKRENVDSVVWCVRIIGSVEKMGHCRDKSILLTEINILNLHVRIIMK